MESRERYVAQCVCGKAADPTVGVEMLSPGGYNDGYEGYGICDLSNDNQYYDYNYGDSGNWGSPSTVTNTASEVKIERTTSDGLWTLTQTVTKEAGPPPYAKVVMALKNNSGITKDAYLIRYAEMIADSGTTTAENYDGSLDSAWGYNSYSDASSNGADAYGMILQNVESPTPVSDVYFWEGYAQDVITGPPPCSPTEYYDGTLTNVSGSAALLYFVELAKEKTVTVTMKYSGF